MKTVHLHIYREKPGVSGVARDESGKVLNDNHLVKLAHGIKEWYNYLAHLKPNGIIKVDVLGFYESTDKDGKFIYDEAPSVVEEVKKAMHVIEKKLTKDEEIELLKKQMAELVATKPVKKEVVKKDETPNVNEELEAARKKYLEVVGKKPHHTKGLEKLNEEIAEKLN